MAFSPRSKEGKACTFQESDGLKLNLRSVNQTKSLPFSFQGLWL